MRNQEKQSERVSELERERELERGEELEREIWSWRERGI